MSLPKKNQPSPHGDGIVILEVPLERLVVSQTRLISRKDKTSIQTLAVDIEEEGLKSLPKAYFAYEKKKEYFYRLFDGVKRWHAYKLLGREFLICIIVPSCDVYSS